MRYRTLLIATLLIAATMGAAHAQPFGNSDPSPAMSCGEYQWPEVQSPCPEVQIKQKHDHTPLLQYRHMGWDTAVTCRDREIVLSCMPYIPVQYFNGGYYVDVIPYDPPDTSFHYGTNLPNGSDDMFCSNAVTIPYPFYFFGIQKTAFAAGGNGIMTFATSAAGQSCNYGSFSAMPWTATSGGGSSQSYPNVTHHRDAIYGVFQDTDPGCSNVSAPRGIYYGIKDAQPCRKIICSYNNLPMYSCGDNTNASSERWNRYQIVCYEGSNIIEVHINTRRYSTYASWCQYGLIGIQNATGLGQVKGTGDVPNRYVITGSPAAYWPANCNPMPNNTDLDNVAYRFTPRGNTAKVYEWYRIFDDGRDSVLLTTDVSDPNGYFTPMGALYGESCPTLTTAVVRPDTVSRYVFHLKFMNANEDWYDLYDTITIGIDTANDLCLRATSQTCNEKTYNLCAGQAANLTLQYPSLQQHDTISYSVTRISNGQRIELDPATVLSLGEWTNNSSSNTQTQTVTLNATLPTQGVMRNKIDSIYVQTAVTLVSGCNNYDSMLVCLYPNFDTTIVHGMCNGDRYTWNGETYTQNAQRTANLHSVPGCDSTVHLDLTVYDVSYTIDHVIDCQPYTWIDGQTYDVSNGATALTDTILLKNMWGCDSVVQLDFTLLPVVARIKASREFFDFDNLDVELGDVSLNNDSRTWILPGGGILTTATAVYTTSADLDEADIWLLAHSPYGCVDSTHIVIPLRKENFWVPNAFMPDNAAGNNLFGSISIKTIEEEMFIYNRHGVLVYHCNTPDCTWDGKDLNGNPCPQGTYTYFIRYVNEFFPKRVQVKRGTVTLIR